MNEKFEKIKNKIKKQQIKNIRKMQQKSNKIQTINKK
jgi:hypothetical protein